jgi:hypothetical protein
VWHSTIFPIQQRERFERADFEKSNAEALNATIREWSRAIEKGLFRAIDVWFDDTRTVVVEQKIGKS